MKGEILYQMKWLYLLMDSGIIIKIAKNITLFQVFRAQIQIELNMRNDIHVEGRSEMCEEWLFQQSHCLIQQFYYTHNNMQRFIFERPVFGFTFYSFDIGHSNILTQLVFIDLLWICCFHLFTQTWFFFSSKNRQLINNIKYHVIKKFSFIIHNYWIR